MHALQILCMHGLLCMNALDLIASMLSLLLLLVRVLWVTGGCHRMHVVLQSMPSTRRRLIHYSVACLLLVTPCLCVKLRLLLLGSTTVVVLRQILRITLALHLRLRSTLRVPCLQPLECSR